MAKKVCILTGANAGIGYQATEILAGERGYEVIMACRNEEKGLEAANAIRNKYPGTSVTVMKLDLSSLDSVKNFVEEFHSTRKPLHVLCNNAGAASPQRKTTKDGFELSMGTNVLGPFLLTNLLLGDLKKTAANEGEARIVVTSSTTHDPDFRAKVFENRGGPEFKFDLDNLHLEKPGTYSGEVAYKSSKLACVIWAKEMSLRLKGTNITCNSFCPGFIPDTKIFGTIIGLSGDKLDQVVKPVVEKGLTRSENEGGIHTAFMCDSKEMIGVTGKYYRESVEYKPATIANDQETRRKFWELCEKLVGLNRN